jgi:uncharacterized protein
VPERVLAAGFAAVLLLALAIFFGSVAIAHGIRDRNRNNTITVTGSAKQRITSDYVVWNLSITSQQPLASAAADQVAGWAKRVRAFLDEEGIRGDELNVEPVAAEAVTGEETGEGSGILAYKLTRTFTIRSTRVRAIRTVAEHGARLLAANVPLEPEPPQYVFTHLPSVRPALLAEATRDAQRRAKVLVEATGAGLGGLRGVDVGVFQVTAPNSTEVTDYGVYDTSTLRKDVSAVVNVTFALK